VEQNDHVMHDHRYMESVWKVVGVGDARNAAPTGVLNQSSRSFADKKADPDESWNAHPGPCSNFLYNSKTKQRTGILIKLVPYWLIGSSLPT
jgi:hypothetical protein